MWKTNFATRVRTLLTMILFGYWNTAGLTARAAEALIDPQAWQRAQTATGDGGQGDQHGAPPLHLAAAVDGAGAQETTPATAPTPASAGDEASKNAAQGLRLHFGPPRVWGEVAYDVRWINQENGPSTTLQLLSTNVNAATYFWQPWFAQLRGGLGAIFSKESDENGGSRFFGEGRSTALTGNAGVSIFPGSRFPFELYGEVADSRASGEISAIDYRNHRFGVSQSYRPRAANASYSVGYDYSRLTSPAFGEDTVTSTRASMNRTFSKHSFDVAANQVLNERSQSLDRSELNTVTARHDYRPNSSFTVENLASYNDTALESPATASNPAGIVSGTTFAQFNSLLTWRPRAGDRLYSADHPLYVIGSFRLLDITSDSAQSSSTARSLNATVGVNYEVNRATRLSGNVSVTRLTSTEGEHDTLTNESIGVTYTPPASNLGRFQYTWNAGANVGHSSGGEEGNRDTVSGQLGHSLTRMFASRANSAWSLNLGQSVAQTSTSDGAGGDFSSLTHNAGVSWRSTQGGNVQNYASLSLSDTRTRGDIDTDFQLLNLQLTRQAQLSRASSWSGNLTFQASRSRIGDLFLFDPAASPQPVTENESKSTVRSYSANLTYQHQRAFNLRGLRYSLLATASNQQLKRRELGDLDAPIEHVTHALENRLDYSIGKLDLRFTARVAEIEGERNEFVFFRISRRLGAQ